MSTEPRTIRLPNGGWQPRVDQLPLWNYLAGGGTRALEFAHRRWGKDDVALHHTACSAMKRIGTYWHMLPEYGQCRKAVWDAVNPRTGKRRIDEAFPEEIRESTRTQDMFIRFVNGSTWSLVGSDNFNSLVGSPPVGLVFSEYALADPKAWGYLRPVLAENGGWAIFITTPRGKNHAYTLFQMAKTDPDWFAQITTILDSGLLTQEQLDKELREYCATFGEEEGRALFRQEWFCSFDGAVSGSYYAPLLEAMEREGRIGRVPYDPLLPVTTAWDLGVGDATAIWFLQTTRHEVRAIDYLEASGEGLSYYVRELKDRPYIYDQHIMPHDIRVRELGSGKSRYETALGLGISPITIARNLPIDDGINAVRATLPKMWVDERKCAYGLSALREYRKEYDDVRKQYKNKPLHNWSSHGNDALRYYCVGYQQPVRSKPVSEIMGNHAYQGAWG
jgi:hypothetical protein